MKAAWVSILTAIAASLYCIGPVVAVTAGAALTAVAVRFEPFRPLFLTLSLGLLGFAFYRVYPRSSAACAVDSTCPPAANRHRRLRGRSRRP